MLVLVVNMVLQLLILYSSLFKLPQFVHRNTKSYIIFCFRSAGGMLIAEIWIDVSA